MVKKAFTLSIRITDEGKHLLDELSEWYGVSKSSVLEMAIREKARSEGIVPHNPVKEEKDKPVEADPEG